jgi:hypothetical protein
MKAWPGHCEQVFALVATRQLTQVLVSLLKV